MDAEESRIASKIRKRKGRWKGCLEDEGIQGRRAGIDKRQETKRNKGKREILRSNKKDGIEGKMEGRLR